MLPQRSAVRTEKWLQYFLLLASAAIGRYFDGLMDLCRVVLLLLLLLLCVGVEC